MPEIDSETIDLIEEKKEKQYLRNIIILIFTLISIIALLTISYRISEENAYLDCRENVREIGIALEIYSIDNAGHYPQELKQLTPTYLKTLPTCPKTGSSRGYEESYRMAYSPDNFTFYCKGFKHTEVRVRPEHPRYDAVNNLQSGTIPGSEKNLIRILLKLIRK